MNGQKYNYSDYEWEPVEEELSLGYYVEDSSAATVPVQAAPLAPQITVTPPDSVLSRPVGELIAAARESIGESVLSRPVGEIFRLSRSAPTT